MRKILLLLIGAGALGAVSAPAAAQYFPGPPARGYGFYGGFGEIRSLDRRIDQIRGQIVGLERRDAIGAHAADRLMHEANEIDRRLRNKSRNGLDPREAGDIQYRVQRLEQQVQWAVQGRWDRFGHRW